MDPLQPFFDDLTRSWPLLTNLPEDPAGDDWSTQVRRLLRKIQQANDIHTKLWYYYHLGERLNLLIERGSPHRQVLKYFRKASRQPHLAPAYFVKTAHRTYRLFHEVGSLQIFGVCAITSRHLNRMKQNDFQRLLMKAQQLGQQNPFMDSL
jgi:hypothetical protein